MEHMFSRRGFLIAVSAAGTGVLMSTKGQAASKQITDLLNPNSPLVMPTNFEPCVWFSMEANGRTTVHIYQAEMGQHVGTALAQIVAEQLCLDWEQVDIDYPVRSLTTPLNNTGRSFSIFLNYENLSRYAAIARNVLLEAGADLMGSDPVDCQVVNGKVIDEMFEKEISYSDILSETVIDYEILAEDLANAPLIERAAFKIIGKSVPALDIPEKLNGSARFGIDAYLPNMRYAKIIVPPTRLGATIVSIDDSAAKNIDGYIETIPLTFPDDEKNGGDITDVPLVIATNYPAAMRASKVIKVEWATNENSSVSSESLMSEAKAFIDNQTDGVNWFSVGDLEKLDTSAMELYEADYQTSMIESAPLEPTSALATSVNGELHIYSSNQRGDLFKLISGVVGVAPEKIFFHPHLLGGSFGKKLERDAIIFASIAALKTKQPIKLIFTREDEFSFSKVRSPSYQRMTASFEKKSKIKGLKHEVVVGWFPYGPKGGNAHLVPPMANGKALDTDIRVQLTSVTGSDNWYDIENLDVVTYHHKKIENVVPIRAVRSVGNSATYFALESFIDEVAHKMDMDPLDLRLSMLKGKGINAGGNDDEAVPTRPKPTNISTSLNGGKRLANVLRLAAGLANYGSNLLPENTAQGISVAGAEGRTTPSFSACVAEVHVDPSSAAISVKKLTLAIDLGIIINPDGAKAQMESALLWGLSNCMYEKMTVQNGAFVETNFDMYRWQNMMNLPELNIHIVENGAYPVGAGEPATSIVAPAIANAIFNASGVRLRSLPFDRNELLKQL